MTPKEREGRRLIIAGCRDVSDPETVGVALEEFVGKHWWPRLIVSGGAPGVDTWGEEMAEAMCIPVKRFPADWKKHGRSAGPIRNREMAANADALLAIWDGSSRGTGSMIREARKAGLLVHISRFDRAP